jgi:Protein of unknown function (DUF1614)
MPRLVEGAGPDAGALQGWIPDPLPEGIDVDGPAFLIQKDIIAAQPRLPAVPEEQIVDRLQAAPPLAYICGSLGTLIGADLLNLGQIQAPGAPIASIGGAGRFDGIFMTGILAVLLA